MKVPLFDLNYDKSEENAVLDVINSKWLTMGNKTQEFEQDFSNYLGGDIYSLGVSSCTAALHLALLANDIKKDDEVIISGLSFVAALNVVNLVGASPVLADSKSLSDWNIDIEDIKRKITPKTKALILVHFAGYPCDMDEIVKLCKEKNIVLIEDSAHSIGAEYKNKKLGTIGDIGCFSFFSNKNLSTGEGGMIVTKSKEIYEKIKLLRSHGMTSLTIDRHNNKAISYDVIKAGLNYRIDEIRSSLGIQQLKKLDSSNQKRKKSVELYNELLNATGLIIPWENLEEYKTSSYHIYPILLPKNIDKTKVIEYLKEKEIQTSQHYPAYKDFTYYKELENQKTPIANEISKRVLTLPLFPDITEEQVNYVCKNLKEILND